MKPHFLFGFLYLLALVSIRAAGSQGPPDAHQPPQTFEANRQAAVRLLAQKQVAAAIPFLERAWRIAPPNYPNAYDLALSYLETRETHKSRQLIESLLKVGDKAELHNLLGDVEEAEGNANAAAREYEKAARIDPSEKNLFDLGSDLLQHRAFTPALKVFEFAVARYAQSARLRVGLGVTYYSLGRFDAAVQSLCQAVDLDPRDTKALAFLGKMQDVSTEYANRVQERLAHFAEIYPQNSSANYYYALSLRRRTMSGGEANRSVEAERYLQNAVKISPHFSDAHFELGLLYEDQKLNEEAAAQYRLAIQNEPKLLKAHYHLARVYQKLGQNKRATGEMSIVQTLKDEHH